MNWARWRATKCGRRFTTAWPRSSAEHRTTLVFVNTRRLAERIAHALGERLGEGAVLPHHGSLSRRLRLEAEQRLKRGELRAVVATASLELGIDIGTVDLVCQIGFAAVDMRWRCSASGARGIGWARSPKAASSRPRATS